MDNNDDLIKLKEYRATCINNINKYNALQTLMSNVEFTNIIMTDYCINSCTDFMSVYANTNLNESVRNNALEAGKACGHLKCYLDTIQNKGRLAEEELIEIDKMIDSLENLPEVQGE